MPDRQRPRHARYLCGAAFAALILAASGAQAQAASGISIAPQSLDTALNELGAQSNQQVLIRADVAAGKLTRGVDNAPTFEVALAELLQGTGLTWRREGETFLIVRASDPQSGSAAGDGAEGTVEALIVTAQKREEDIQDVPIAISAFTSEALDQQKIEGGFDLVKAIPNVSFTKTNFTSYNFQIRGIGTQAISATTDPGVAVAFNNTGILQNRLFEQEYLDIERVEVLRGPQGTLYGRNATAGVINVISAKPRMGEFLGELKMEVGNYDTSRLRGMVNIPIGETFAIRAAAAGTRRDGYVYNAGTGRQIDGRELWTGRVTLGWEPTERLRGNLIWEHFEEDDNRLRTGKQLCHRDDGPTEVGGQTLNFNNDPNYTQEEQFLLRRAFFGQGCAPGSLYEDAAFGTPNGLSYSFVLGTIMASRALFPFTTTSIGRDPVTGRPAAIIQFRDPYGGKMQSRDLREISSILDPRYRARADILELNFDFDLTDSLTFYSQTAYVDDETYSFQDFNRFNTEPVFTDTSLIQDVFDPSLPTVYEEAAPGGIFCDPQLGCSNTIAGFDIAQASATQFSQEFRLQSDFDAPWNFSIGANYTKFDTLIDYYVMFNLITAMASIGPFNAPVGSIYDNPNFSHNPNAPYDPTVCAWSNIWRGIAGLAEEGPVPTDHPRSACPYIDPNPVDHSRNFEGEGHNYFRSKNPYNLESWAAFGESYWNISEDLKLTVGLRYTDDRKRFVVVPSQVLLAPSYLAGGTVAKGYPETGVIKQEWGEWTGRLVLDWRPDLTFTDDTMVYGSFSRGYKGGGANPPRPGFATKEELVQIALDQGTPQELLDFIEQFLPGLFPVLELTADEYEDTFEAEFVNAFEVGTKNTLLGGGLTLNLTGFYYDYTDYQISQIRDRTAVNENFDATMWGLELESIFVPSENWQFLANIGYLDTRVADGETSIDIMNRTQGNPDYVLAKPWVQLPSNCVVPAHVAAYHMSNSSFFDFVSLCGVGGLLGSAVGPARDPNFGFTVYDHTNYPELNGGAGLLADLSGNELPNAPHWTANIGGQYTFHLPDKWRMVVRADAYWQSQSYHRIYNAEPYDKLRAWTNANLSVWFDSPDEDLRIELYVKNIFDETPITGAFLNSDDTGLTTNVFLLDPRLIGLNIRKSF